MDVNGGIEKSETITINTYIHSVIYTYKQTKINGNIHAKYIFCKAMRKDCSYYLLQNFWRPVNIILFFIDYKNPQLPT